MNSLPSVRVLRDIRYGEARIGYSRGAGPMQTVPLCFDAYLPQPSSDHPAPALVMAFGGAFHRGSKEDDAFPAAGSFGPNTAVAEYCRRFAAEGFACFSVGYRLAPEDPDPGTSLVLTRPDAVPMGRVDEVRRIMGLPPIGAAEMAGAMEAAIDDVAAAARAIHDSAREFGIDRDRIVLGGWSAGARCALYAAYADRVPCTGVIALSGVMEPEDLQAHVRSGQTHPSLLLIAAENDLGYIAQGAERTVRTMRESGCNARLVRVPGRDHWYAAEAMTDTGASVQETVRATLRDWMGS